MTRPCRGHIVPRNISLAARGRKHKEATACNHLHTWRHHVPKTLRASSRSHKEATACSYAYRNLCHCIDEDTVSRIHCTEEALLGCTLKASVGSNHMQQNLPQSVSLLRYQHNVPESLHQGPFKSAARSRPHKIAGACNNDCRNLGHCIDDDTMSRRQGPLNWLQVQGLKGKHPPETMSAAICLNAKQVREASPHREATARLNACCNLCQCTHENTMTRQHCAKDLLLA